MLVHTTELIDLLIVDSQGVEYLSLSRGGEQEGLQIVQANEGYHALQLASSRPARVWVANLKLPDMTGIELLKLIKAKRAATPFYLVSDRYSPDDEIAARTAGATGYLSKPVNANWLDFCRAALARQPGAPAARPQFDGIKI
jgi:DNA-binding response OmpR family regulator